MKKISYGLRLYLFLSFLLDPFYLIYQLISVLRGKENPKRFWERWVTKKIKRPSGKLIWLHAASVGESLSLLPLIEKIIADNTSSAINFSNNRGFRPITKFEKKGISKRNFIFDLIYIKQ